MSRETVHAEMKQLLGQVPGFLGALPEATLEAEWAMFKQVEMGDSSIPPKYRELIGIGVAAAHRCWYCANFHTAMARFHGATDEEVQEATLLAKFGANWSTYLNGTLYDQTQFLKELREIGAYLSK